MKNLMHLFGLVWLLGAICSLYADQGDVCAFCKQEVIEKQVVFATENFWVLADYAPITTGHLLIVPKQHVRVLQDLDPKLGSELIVLFKKVADAFQAVLYT